MLLAVVGVGCPKPPPPELAAPAAAGSSGAPAAADEGEGAGEQAGLTAEQREGFKAALAKLDEGIGLLERSKDPAGAVVRLGEVLPLFRDLGQKRPLMKTLWKSGLARAELKEVEKAVAELTEALRLAEELNVPATAREVKRKLAEIRPKPAAVLEQPEPNLTEADFWGWVEIFAQRRDLAGLTEQTRRYADQKYGIRIFNGLWDKLLALEKAGEGAKVRKLRAETEILAQALRDAIGDREPLERWQTHFALDQKAREEVEWANGRLEAARSALETEKDAASALARLEAALPVLRKHDQKAGILKSLRLMAKCHEARRNSPKAVESLQEAIQVAHELGDLDAVREMDEELARIRKG